MAQNASRAHVPLNGEEIKQLVLRRVAAVLDADSRLKRHLSYPQVAFSVGFRMTYYPSDGGPIEHAITGRVGEAPAGAPDLVPPMAVTEELAPMTQGNIVVGPNGGDRRQVATPVGDRASTPGVRSYASGPAPDRQQQQLRQQRTSSITEAVQRAVRATEAAAAPPTKVVRPQDVAEAPVGEIERAPVPDRFDTAIDPAKLQIDRDGERTVRNFPASGGGVHPGDRITGGVAPVPPGIAAVIAEQQAPERVAAEAARVRQRLEAQGAGDPVMGDSAVVINPNTARRDAGMPVPQMRMTRHGQMVDLGHGEF